MDYSQNFYNNVCDLLRSDIFAAGNIDLAKKFKIGEGVCFGLACMWMQAVLCDEVKKFNIRMRLLCHDSKRGWTIKGCKFHNLVDSIKRLRNLYKTQNLTEPEYILLEIPAFIEGILLYTAPLQTSLSAYVDSRQNVIVPSSYVLPRKLEYPAQNGLNKSLNCVYGISVAGNQAEYCRLLTNLCNTMSSQGGEYGIMLSSFSHVIGLSYKKNKFTVFDQNLLTENYHGSVETPAITTAVGQIFVAFRKSTSLVCRIEVYVAPQTHNASDQITASHAATLTNVCQAAQLDLFCMALQYGESELVERILVRHPSFLERPDYLGMSPLYRACYYGQKHVVQKLLERGASPNSKPQNGETSLFIASFFGYSEVVELLLQSGAGPDEITANGYAILQKVIARKHPQIMQLLQKAREDKKRKSVFSHYQVVGAGAGPGAGARLSKKPRINPACT